MCILISVPLFQDPGVVARWVRRIVYCDVLRTIRIARRGRGVPIDAQRVVNSQYALGLVCRLADPSRSDRQSSTSGDGGGSGSRAPPENDILPPSIYSKDVEVITKVLEVDKVLQKFDDPEALQWATFPKDPEKSGQHEDETFKHIGDYCQGGANPNYAWIYYIYTQRGQPRQSRCR